MTLNHNTIVTKSGLTFNTDQQGGKFSPSPLNSLSSKDIFSLSTSALAIGEVQKHDPVFNLNPLLLENHNLNFTEEHPTGEKTLDQIFSWHKTAAIDNAAPSNVTPPQGVTQKDLINFSNSSYEPLIFIKPFQNNFGDYQPGKIYNTLDVANFEPPVSNEVKIFYEAATDAEFAQAAGLKTELESLSKFDFKDIASDTLPSLTAEVHNERLIQHAPVTEITVPVVTHPQANPDINSYTEGTSINPTGNVLINDNANNNVLVVSNPGTYQGTYGTLILNANGSYTYIHKDPSSHPETQNALNTLGDHQDVFTYGLDNGNTSTLTIKIIPIEFTPVMQPQANPDTNSYVEGSGTPVTGNVLSNDDTNRGGDLTVSNPGTYVGTYGDLTLNQDGTYTYAPHDPSTDSATLQALNTAGPHQDVFNYTDTNASGAMTSSTITVTIATNPHANADTNNYTEGSGTPVTGNVLSNDNTNRGGDLTVSNPGTYVGTYGDLTLNQDGTYTYMPHDPSTDPATLQALNTPGVHQDVFNYTDTNASGATTSSTITVTIATNPHANADTNNYTEGSGTPVTGNVLSNDDTNRGGDLTVSNPGTYVGTYGDLTLNQDGTYTYMPHDPSTDPATLQALNTPGVHQDVFNYTDTNASGATTSSTITVTIATNPHANADTNNYTEGSGTPVTGNVLSNDNTNRGGDLTVSNPGTYVGTYGDLTLNQDGTYTYMPHDPSTDPATLQALNTAGPHQDVFNYTDTNASGATTSSTITVTIATNPHANADTNSYTEDSSTSVTGNVLSNDDTNRGGDLTVSNPGTYVGTYGDLTLNQDGTYTYMPHDPSTDSATLQALNTPGVHQDVFNYTDTNASGATTSSTITVTIATNPHANADTNNYTEGSGTPVTGNVLSNDDTNRGGDLTVSNPGTYVGTYGDLTLNQDGTYTYMPHDPSTDPATLQALNTPGVHQDVFNYTDTNASGATTSSTITVTIATNPHANPDTNSYTEGSGTPVTGNVLSNDDTNRGGDLTVTNPGTYTGTYGDLTLNQDGTYTYAPHDPSTDSATLQALSTPGFHEDVFNYTDTNASGATTSSSLTITVKNPPVVEEARYGNSIQLDGAKSVPYDSYYQNFNTNSFPLTKEGVNISNILDPNTGNPQDLSKYLVNNITLENDLSDLTVNFVNHSASNQNTIGWYQIDPNDGTIFNVQLIWPDTSNANSVVDLGSVTKGEQIGFFLISDGYGANGQLYQENGEINTGNSSGVYPVSDILYKIMSDVDKGYGYLKFEADYYDQKNATINDASPHLVYIPTDLANASVTKSIELISSTGTQTGIYHTATSSSEGFALDGDNLQHTIGSLVANGIHSAVLQIGFEDSYASQSDRDFNDDVFQLNLPIGATNFQQADSNHINVSLTDLDGTQLTKSVIQLSTNSGGINGDNLVLPDFTLSGTPDAEGYYQITNGGYHNISIKGLGSTLSSSNTQIEIDIKGTDTHAHYQDVLDDLHINNAYTVTDPDMAAGTRNISIQVYDEDNIASNVANIPYIITHLTPINTIDAYNLDGDQYIYTDTTITGRVIYGNDADDIFQIAGSNNVIFMGDGNNQFISTGGHDLVFAGSGNNTIYTSGGNNIILTGSSNDYIDAGPGANDIYVKTGQPTIAFQSSDINSGGVDTIDGYSTSQFPKFNPVIFDLSQILHSTSYIPGVSNIDNFVEIKEAPNGTQATLEIDTTGQANFTTSLAIIIGVSQGDIFNVFDGNYHKLIATQ